jgi:hypothetical protein
MDRVHRVAGSIVKERQDIMVGMLAVLSLGSVTVAKPAVKTPEFFGSLRVRSESWGWFNPAGGGYNNSYTFSHNQLRFGGRLPTAHRLSGIRPFETVAEVASPLLLGLPGNAVAPAPGGTLGMGGQYRLTNGTQQGSMFFKTAYIHMPQQGMHPDIVLGRYEFADGLEALPGDADLAYIQTQRIASRMISPDPFTAVGRSMDGFKVSRTINKHSQTLAGFYPTTGAFNMDGGDTISKVRQLYFADASSTATSSNRFFVGHYVDARGITPVDNAATLNSGSIEITTLGGHALSGKTYGKSRVDTFLWGGTQTGNWGAQVHQAFAAAAEIGFKSPETKGWWLRGGAGYFSGDANPNDAKHQSWAPQTYAPRLLFRTPVVTESNLQDFYAMAVKRNKRETIRLEAHAYRVDKPADRWYLGGPVFQSGGAFGLNGKPTAGMRDIGSAVDISYDVTLNQRDTLNIYAGYVHGGAVAATSYSGRSAFLGFVQLVRKF